jgi:hypothetical protein
MVSGSISGTIAPGVSHEPMNKVMSMVTTTLKSRQACLVTDLSRVLLVSHRLPRVTSPSRLDSRLPHSPDFPATSVALSFQCPWGEGHPSLTATRENVLKLSSWPFCLLFSGLDFVKPLRSVSIYLRLCLPELSVAITQKQSWTMSKQMDVPVLQQNFIFKSRLRASP